MGAQAGLAMCKPMNQCRHPPPAGQREGFDPALFPLKIVKLDFDLNPSKRGWDKF